jgi:HPt (histidine-containing phosphotransfer) domain-containing protein
MDGYLSKPIDTEALWRELETIGSNVSTPAAPTADARKDPAMSGLSFDLNKSLSLMNDDKEMFEEVVKIYLEDSRIYLENLGKAINAGDAEQIRYLAHTIKGMLSVFAVPEIASIAERIEKQSGVDHRQDHAELTEAMIWLGDTLTGIVSGIHSNHN